MRLVHVGANHSLVCAYDAFTQELFGFDLSAWRTDKEAYKQYRTFSLVEGREVVANVSAMEMHLTIEGKRRKGIQLGSVGVRQKYRGQGLTYKLVSFVLAAYPEADFFYLLSDDTLIPFYRKHGFRPLKEKLLTVELSGVEPAGALSRITMEDPRFWKCYDENQLQSGVFDAHENRALYRFHLIMGLKECLYVVDEKPLVIVGSLAEEVFEVYDLIGTASVKSGELLSYLAGFGAKHARFHFNPDALGIDGLYQVSEEDVFFYLGNFPLVNRPFKSPATGRT